MSFEMRIKLLLFVFGSILAGAFLMLLIQYVNRWLLGRSPTVTLEKDPESQISGMLYGPMKEFVRALRKECQEAVKRLSGMPEHTQQVGKKDIEEHWVKSIDRLIAADRDAAKNALYQNGLAIRSPYGHRSNQANPPYGIVAQPEPAAGTGQ